MKNLERAATDRVDVGSCKNRSGGGQKWIYAGVHQNLRRSDGRCVLTGRIRIRTFLDFSKSFFFQNVDRRTFFAQISLDTSLKIGDGIWLVYFSVLLAYIHKLNLHKR